MWTHRRDSRTIHTVHVPEIQASSVWRHVLPFHPGRESLTWWLTRVMVAPLAQWGLGFRAFGVEHVPPTGPVILASNHYSNWDPVWVAYPLPRASHFFASEGLFHHPRWGVGLRWLITAYHALPADPRKPAAALKRARRVLERGGALVIFPEGQRNFSERVLLPFQTGTALLAAMTGAPTVPVFIHRGVQRGIQAWITRRAPLAVFYGTPLPPPSGRDRDGLERWTADLFQRVLALARMARAWDPRGMPPDYPDS